MSYPGYGDIVGRIIGIRGIGECDQIAPDHLERAFRISKSKIEILTMFHFTRRRIEAHVCICFVALKVYKELERLLKLSEVRLSVDKVLALARTIVTIQITLPQNKKVLTKTMIMKRHQRIASLFAEEFWGTH